MSGTCRRCGETSASFCEDWDCHLGWGEPTNTEREDSICTLNGCACGGFEHDVEEAS